jgi:hypothetical protein
LELPYEGTLQLPHAPVSASAFCFYFCLCFFVISDFMAQTNLSLRTPATLLIIVFNSTLAIAAIDVDGDGEISTTDLQAYWLAFKNMMAHAVPSSAGFGAGFALGLYYS